MATRQQLWEAEKLGCRDRINFDMSYSEVENILQEARRMCAARSECLRLDRYKKRFEELISQGLCVGAQVSFEGKRVGKAGGEYREHSGKVAQINGRSKEYSIFILCRGEKYRSSVWGIKKIKKPKKKTRAA